MSDNDLLIEHTINLDLGLDFYVRVDFGAEFDLDLYHRLYYGHDYHIVEHFRNLDTDYWGDPDDDPDPAGGRGDGGNGDEAEDEQ